MQANAARYCNPGRELFHSELHIHYPTPSWHLQTLLSVLFALLPCLYIGFHAAVLQLSVFFFFSLFYILSLLIIIYGKNLFCSCLSGILNTSFICMAISFSKLGTFFCYDFISLLFPELVYTCVPNIHKSNLLMMSLTPYMFFLYFLIN